VPFLYIEPSPSRICYNFTTKLLYVSYNDVELVK
jgi:hypothetical protein